MNFIEKEKDKLEQGRRVLLKRRLKWSLFVKPRTLSFCKKFADDGNNCNYPYHLFCNIGSKDINAETIQFGIGINDTGIERKEVIYQGDEVANKHTRILEKGGSLVFSQGPTGKVMVLLYPYKSEVHQRNEEYIILYNDIEPQKLTKKLILNALHQSLFYARLSSLNGISNGYSISDRIKLFSMLFFDVRSRIKRRQAVLKLKSNWGQMLVTAIITLVITLIAQNFAPS